MNAAKEAYLKLAVALVHRPMPGWRGSRGPWGPSFVDVGDGCLYVHGMWPDSARAVDRVLDQYAGHEIVEVGIRMEDLAAGVRYKGPGTVELLQAEEVRGIPINWGAAGFYLKIADPEKPCAS